MEVSLLFQRRLGFGQSGESPPTIPPPPVGSAKEEMEGGGGDIKIMEGRERLHGIGRIVRRVGECLLTAFDHSATATKGEKTNPL